MSKHVTASDIRKDVSKGLQGGNTGNGNSGRGLQSRVVKNLRNRSAVPDEVLQREIDYSERKLRDEFPNRFLSLDTEEEKQAIRYLTYIKVAFLSREESGPSSYSQARRFRYDDTQLEYWRDEMVRALEKI